MSAGGAFGGSRGVQTKAPEKGVFPLDHFNECTQSKDAYMKCLADNQGNAKACQQLARTYLECRMDRGLMAKQSLEELGLAGMHQPKETAVKHMVGPKTTASDLDFGQSGQTEVLIECAKDCNSAQSLHDLSQLTPLKVIGRSANGTRVIQAHHRQRDELVAVKILPRKTLSAAHQAQIVRGLRVHAQCVGMPHVLPLHAVLQDETQLYIITAFAAKGDLAQFMANAGRTLSAAQAVKYVLRPLLQAVASMHAQQLIHRDIKPENCLMGDGNVILLSDFDLSIDAKVDAPCDQVGTPDFVAPEVLSCRPPATSGLRAVSSARAYTAACDCWAVGVLATELLAGQAPFSAPTTDAIKDNVRKGNRAPMPEDWSAERLAFIDACLIRDPAKRLSAQALLQHPWMQALT